MQGSAEGGECCKKPKVRKLEVGRVLSEAVAATGKFYSWRRKEEKTSPERSQRSKLGKRGGGQDIYTKRTQE